MATYRLDTLGLLQPEPVELDDGSFLHELPAAGASRAGVSVATDPAPPEAVVAELGPDELLIDREECTLAGFPAIRTLILVQLGGLATVVLEQWRLVAAGERWLITATADLALWPRLSTPLRTAVASFEVEPDAP